MSIRGRLLVLGTLVAVASIAARAQAPRAGVMGDLLADVDAVERKVVGLANAMPEASYAWRPMPGVRSVGEALTHVAADNYFMPAALGVAAPAATGISGTNYDTVEAFEKKTRSRTEIIAELERSFAFLKDAMRGTPDAKLDTTMKLFGQEARVGTTWVMTVTHLHEHLGQLIAYARSNKVVPPWSK
ncbi:MAG: DinB family protein [Vicinamibacterales bacterium]